MACVVIVSLFHCWLAFFLLFRLKTSYPLAENAVSGARVRHWLVTGQGLPWCRARCFHPFVSEAAASSFSSIGVCKKCVPEPDAVATVCPFHLPCKRTNDFPEMASKTDRAGRVVWVCWAFGRVRLGRKIGSNRG